MSDSPKGRNKNKSLSIIFEKFMSQGSFRKIQLRLPVHKDNISLSFEKQRRSPSGECPVLSACPIAALSHMESWCCKVLGQGARGFLCHACSGGYSLHGQAGIVVMYQPN